MDEDSEIPLLFYETYGPIQSQFLQNDPGFFKSCMDLKIRVLINPDT